MKDLDKWKIRWAVLFHLHGENEMTRKEAAMRWEEKIDPSSAARHRFVSLVAGHTIESFNELTDDELFVVEMLIQLYADEIRVAEQELKGRRETVSA